MNASIRDVLVATVLALCSLSAAAEAVPINATFGIGWAPVDWSNPADRITESLGASGLANGTVIGIALRDHLDTINGAISSDYAILAFSDSDWVYARYDGIPATYDPATNTASFFGPLTIVGGEGRFTGASGTLTLRSKILFHLPVGTVYIKGVITTGD